MTEAPHDDRRRNEDSGVAGASPCEPLLPARTAPPKNYFLPMQVAILAYVAANFLVGLLRTYVRIENPSLMLALNAIPLDLAATAGFLLILAGHSRGDSLAELLHWRPLPEAPKARLVFPARLLIMSLSAMAAALATHYLTCFLGWQHTPQNIVFMLSRTNSTMLFLSLATLATIVAPVSEEIVFRVGVHQSCLLAMPPATATLATALIFSLAHGQLSTIPPLFVVGLFLQQAKKVGGLRLSILLHSAYNGIQILIIMAMRAAEAQ